MGGQPRKKGYVVKSIYIASGKQLRTKTFVQHSMKMAYWTVKQKLQTFFSLKRMAQTQVRTLFSVNDGHNMNSLSTNSKHWSTNNHGDRVGRECGLVVGIKLWVHNPLEWWAGYNTNWTKEQFSPKNKVNCWRSITFQHGCGALPKCMWLLATHPLSLVCKMRRLLDRLMYATGMK